MSPRPSALIVGGVAESLVNFRGDLIQALRARGLTVHAAAPDLAPGSGFYETLASWGVVPHRICLARTGINPLVDLRTLRDVYELLERIRPDHLLTYTPKPLIYGTLAGRLAGVRSSTALVTGLGYAFTAGQGGAKRQVLQAVLRQLYRVALKGATQVVFQNEDDKKVFVDLGLVAPERTGVINGSGIHLSRFPLTPLPPLQAEIHFLLIARLLRDKGIYEFVEAARAIRKDHPRARFHLVGWIDTNPAAIAASELDRWIAEGIVEHHGRLADVRPAIAACHVYVLPSYREGTPRTVLEAMAMGRPIITTDAPGCRGTVVDGQTGYLVSVRDASALAGAMRRFLEEPQRIERFGRASRALAEEKYDVVKVNERLMEYMGIGSEQ